MRATRSPPRAKRHPLNIASLNLQKENKSVILNLQLHLKSPEINFNFTTRRLDGGGGESEAKHFIALGIIGTYDFCFIAINLRGGLAGVGKKSHET